MRTADPIGTAYDRLLQSMQTYRSTQLSFFRGIGRSGKRTPSHSQHCSGLLVAVSMLRGYRRINTEEIPRKRYTEAMMSTVQGVDYVNVTQHLYHANLVQAHLHTGGFGPLQGNDQ